MAATLALGKPLVFSCGEVLAEGAGGGRGFLHVWRRGGGAERVEVARGDQAFHMLRNCGLLVDVEASQCAVAADKERELANIGEENWPTINRTVNAALDAGAMALSAQVWEVDAFNCGEPGPLRTLADEQVGRAFAAASSAGQLAVLIELHRARAVAVAACLKWSDGLQAAGALQQLSMNGWPNVVEWLLEEVGVEVNVVMDAKDFPFTSTPLSVAAQKGHLEVVRVLVKAGANVNQVDPRGLAPLHHAAHKGRLGVLQFLIKAGADVNQAVNDDGVHTPIMIAAQEAGTNQSCQQAECIRALVEAGARVPGMDPSVRIKLTD